MNTPRFDIIGCALLGIRSAFAERRYLLGIGLVPVALTAMIEMLKIYGLPQESVMTALLTMLPVSVMTAWFMFLQTRLLVFGERAGQPAAASGEERRRAFEISVLMWLLVQMGGFGLMLFFLHWNKAVEAGEAAGWMAAVGCLLIGMAFWAMRFVVAHILGAIGYSIRAYIFRVNGAMVSLRLIALLMILFLPVSLVAGPVEQGLYTALQTEAQPLIVAGLVITRVFLQFVLLAFFNAAAVFALREMLGKDGPRRGVMA